MTEHHRLRDVEHIWDSTRHNKAKAVAKWAKRGGSWKERVKRWEAIEQFAHNHQLTSQHTGDLKRAHKFWLIYRWVRSKARRIKRHHKPRHDPTGSGTCGVALTSWAGSQAAGECVATNVARDFGLAITSRKRSPNDPLSIANPSSDHNEANTTAYAWDIGTFSGQNVAVTIARDLGIGGYSTGNYTDWYISRPWGRFRVQILWAVAGHFNHVHVGMRRA